MTPLARRTLLFAPLGVAAVGGGLFFGMLRDMQTGEYNPRGVPSALIGRPVPDFALPPVEGAEMPGFSQADLARLGGPVLVNFWASWCVPCIVEHPQLMRLSREGITVAGIAYKDRDADSVGFLRRHGNPFRLLAKDQPGRTAIDWGVYGVPETYLVDRQGIIRWRFAGPITDEVLAQDLRPLLRRYAS
ncbi:MAG TPA: DsbE family thiol:disulfide interchange protein [Acetobacteraceae bacterium]|jgi:cytochrome c biogenesis protein CcmG/thiol:disulfide interchange protein DsbE|nr:DsbE family thiol:disulfide interchange protein [Acetobacteraceae bacterium]